MRWFEKIVSFIAQHAYLGAYEVTFDHLKIIATTEPRPKTHLDEAHNLTIAI